MCVSTFVDWPIDAHHYHFHLLVLVTSGIRVLVYVRIVLLASSHPRFDSRSRSSFGSLGNIISFLFICCCSSKSLYNTCFANCVLNSTQCQTKRVLLPTHGISSFCLLRTRWEQLVSRCKNGSRFLLERARALWLGSSIVSSLLDSVLLFTNNAQARKKIDFSCLKSYKEHH